MRGGRPRRGQALRQGWVVKADGRRAAGRAQRRWHGVWRASAGFGWGIWPQEARRGEGQRRAFIPAAGKGVLRR